MLVCKKCNSEKVLQKFWVNPNDMEIDSIVINDNKGNWCDECEDYTELVEQK